MLIRYDSGGSNGDAEQHPSLQGGSGFGIGILFGTSCSDREGTRLKWPEAAGKNRLWLAAEALLEERAIWLGRARSPSMWSFGYRIGRGVADG